MGLERIIVFGAITVGVNRTFALAKVTCPQGRCSIEKLNGAKLRIKGRSYKAQALFPGSSFSAGQTRNPEGENPPQRLQAAEAAQVRHRLGVLGLGCQRKRRRVAGQGICSLKAGLKRG